MNGRTFRVLRKQLGWSQSQVAAAIGVTPNTAARWERGEVAVFEPAARLFKILAQQRGATIADLAVREKTKTPSTATCRDCVNFRAERLFCTKKSLYSLESEPACDQFQPVEG